MSIKQIGDRYRVRQDPYFHGFWCIVDRVHMLNAPFIDWDFCALTYVSNMAGYLHFRDADDALQMVKLLEISDKVNKGD